MNESGAPVVDEIDALAKRIVKSAADIDAAIHRLLTDLRVFDAEEGWARQGAASCAHWLNWKCGITLGVAREKVRVAHALGELPQVDEALRRGDVSYSKVRAITRVATKENEESLLEIAGFSSGSQMERICRLYAQGLPRTPEQEAARRYLRVHDTDDGMVRIEAVLKPEEAARVIQACEVDGARWVDGLLAMAEGALRGEAPNRPPVEVILHVDATTLVGQGDEVGVSAATSERLLCDAGVVPVVDGEQGPLDFGRKMRTVSGALRRALLARDGQCRFPGCTHRGYLDGHHIQHWIRGGKTSLGNCLLLCTLHHGLVHEGGFRIRRVGGESRFFSPRGEDLSAVQT